jgi:hypothetical protein
MTLHFTLDLKCTGCGAALRFDDERPDWQTYDVRVEEPEACERSAAFVAAHADEPLPPPYEPWPAYEEAGRPPYVTSRPLPSLQPFEQWRQTAILDIPEPRRYVNCPACDARVWEPRDERRF